MTLRDFKSGDKTYISMIKGTDRFYDIYMVEDDGLPFLWDSYTIRVEGRYSTLSSAPDFTFDVVTVTVEDVVYGRIVIPAIEINDSVRESRIHFKVFATKDGNTRIICYGEIWLVS